MSEEWVLVLRIGASGHCKTHVVEGFCSQYFCEQAGKKIQRAMVEEVTYVCVCKKESGWLSLGTDE